jgi:hypothetical protein
LVSLGRVALAEAHLALGRSSEAKRIAELVMTAPATISLAQTAASSVLARVALSESDPEGALAHADRGLAIAAASATSRCRSELAMSKAEALDRLRRAGEARAVRAETRARVERIAASLGAIGNAPLRDAWMRLTANRLAML